MRIFSISWSALHKLIYDGGLAIASNVAVSLLLSLFPFLMLIAALLRLYGDPSVAQQVVNLLLGAWPGDAERRIVTALETLLSQDPSEFFSIPTVIAVVLATNGIESARDGLNRAYKVTERRSFLWRRVQGVLFIVLGAVGLIGANFILVGAAPAWDYLVARLPVLAEFSFGFLAIKWSMALALLWAVLFAFHKFLPDLKGHKRSLRWGIFVTMVSIVIGSQAFGYYLQNFANYTALYAGLAGMMVVIIYLYCMSVLLLFGAELNTALAEDRGALDKQS